MGETQVVLQTKLGLLRGHSEQSAFSGKTFYAFKGIPYAKPPLGELRFKAPQPFGRWEGIRDAEMDGNEPKQPFLAPIPGVNLNQVATGDEDCLYLNIYMKELPRPDRSKKPVMFNIPGGGFFGWSGTSKHYGPDFFMLTDIILVSISYRCGPFGFLSLENEQVPGNAGLKDQTLALKWVRDNIDCFGGDTDNITIFGCSAGGVSVNFQLLSPSSKGLFHKAIIHSGFASNPWAIQKRPRALATRLAKALGCVSEDSDKMLQFLQSASADDIIVAAKEMSQGEEHIETMSLIFIPCVEVSGSEPFLRETPDNVMKRGDFHHVPVILGACQNEGSVFFMLSEINEEHFKYMNTHPELLVPSSLGLEYGSVEMKEVERAVWDFYFKGKPLSKDNVKEYSTYRSDVLFNLGMDTTRTALVKKSSAPVYTYLFSNHNRCMNFLNKQDPFPETCHGADFAFLFIINVLPMQELTPEQRTAIEKHIKVWTNFASFGNPNCKELEVAWDKDSETNPCFMEIGTSWNLRQGVPFSDRFDFWRKLDSQINSA